MDRLGVIFDMDGVLVNSYQPHLISWQRSAATRGLEMTEPQFAATFGKTSREIIRQFWPSHAGPEEVRAWDAEKESLYRDLLREDFPQMDGAGELLQALHRDGFALAIGSSGPAENVAVVVECMPDGELFAATVNGHDVEHGKPAPDVFLTAAAKISLKPHQCAVVEDAPVGVQAARAAGMAVIAMTGTVPREQLAAADRIIDSLRELTPQLIAELIQGRNP